MPQSHLVGCQGAAFCDRKKTPANNLLTAVSALWRERGSAQMAKHRSTCVTGLGHGEHLQSLCLGISWGDTKAANIQVLGTLVSPQLFSVGSRCNMSSLEPKHFWCSSEKVAEGKQQTMWCFYIGFPCQLWQAAEVRVSSQHCTGMVFGSVWSKAMRPCTGHQPPTSQRDAELHLALRTVWVGIGLEVSYLLFHNFIAILWLIKYLRMTLHAILVLQAP